jgi:chaperone modulatory protein CbpM
MNMEQTDFILVEKFCSYHDIDESFIYSLDELGLINIQREQEKKYIPPAELPKLEMFTRFYSELGFNIEAMETITYLLEKIREMHREMQQLTEKLAFYESEEKDGDGI